MSYSVVCNLTELTQDNIKGSCEFKDEHVLTMATKTFDISGWDDLTMNGYINELCTKDHMCNVKFMHVKDNVTTCNFNILSQYQLLGHCGGNFLNTWDSYNSMMESGGEPQMDNWNPGGNQPESDSNPGQDQQVSNGIPEAESNNLTTQQQNNLIDENAQLRNMINQMENANLQGDNPVV